MEEKNTEEVSVEMLSDEELEQLPTVSKKIYRIIYLAIALILCGLAFGLYHFYPFYGKMAGTWEAPENSSYQLEVSGKEASFTVKDIQNTSGLDMVFRGDLTKTGANRYRMKDVGVFLELEKDQVTADELENIKAQEELYTVVFEDDDQLELQYSSEAVESAFAADVNTMFYFTIEDFKFGLIPTTVRLRNETLSQTSFLLEKSD